MGDGVNIDTLEIEVEASSEQAAKKLNGLTESLRKLQEQTKQKFGNIFKQIGAIGENASPAEKKLHEKMGLLKRVGSVDVAKNVRGVSSLVGNVSKLERELDKARKLREQIGQEMIDLQDKLDAQLEYEPKFRNNGAIKDLENQLEDLGKEADTQEGKIRTLEATLGNLRDSLYTGKDLSSVVAESNAAVEEAKAKAKELAAQMREVAKDAGFLGKERFGLTNDLAKAEIQAVKTDGALADMRRKLEDMSKVEGVGGEAKASILAAQENVERFASAAAEVKDIIEDIRAASDVLNNTDLSLLSPQEIRESAAELKNLKQEYREASDAAKLAGEITKNSMAEAKTALKGVKGSGPEKELGFLAQVNELAKVRDEIVKLTAPVRKLVASPKDVGRSALGAAKDLAKLGLSGIGSALGRIADGAKSVGKHIADRVTRPFKSAAAVVEKWKVAIGRIAFYRVVREAIKQVTDGLKTGIQNLYQYSRIVGTEFAPAMNSLATSSLYLKNSLGAMAAPLIQALAPAVDFIIDKFVALLNVIGKVFAALTGKSVYTQAKKHAVEYGEAAKDASKATKDFLLGIDELNVLNDSSGGAGGAASDFGNMFEEVEVPNDIKDWTDKIRKAIEEGDWRGTGSILADKLNEIVENWDAYGWGKKLGEKINNALNFAYGFLKEFNFENLGLKVADFFNGIFDTVDWDLAGRVFAAGWNGLMEFIYGLIDGFHWDVFGKAIADAIIGFFSEIDWELPIKILRAGIEGVRQALVGFLSELGERLDIHGITDPLIEIVNTVAGTLQRLITDTQIWFSQLDFTPLITSFELLLAAVSPFVSLISEGLLWGYENVLLPLATWTIEEAVPAAVNVLTAAFGLLTAAIERLAPIVKSFIETVVPAAKKVIIDALNGIRDVFEKLTSLIRGDTTFKEFFESLSAGEKIAIALGVAIGGITLALGIAGTAISVFSGIAKSAHAIVEALKLAIEGASLVLSLITSPVGIAVAAIAGLIAVVALCAAHFESFREVVVQVWEGVKTTLSEVASWFMTYVVTPIVDGWNNFIKPVIDSLVKHLGDAITNHIVPLLKTAMQVIGKVAEIVGFVFDKIIGPIVKWVIDVAAPIVGTAIGFIGDVFISLANTIADVSTGILEVFGGVIDFVAGVFTGDWERAWNGVKEIFAGVWDAIAGIIEAPVNFIIRQINRVIEGLNKIQVPDWVPVVGGKGFHLTPIEEFDLPRKGSAYSSRSSYSNNRNYDWNNGKIMYGETGSEFRERVNSGSYNSDLLSGIKDMTKMSDSITDLMNGLKSVTQAQTESNVGVSESISELLSKIENTDYQTPPQSSLYTPGMASPLASPMGTLPNSYNSNSQGSGSSYDGAAIINAINAQGDRIVDAINSQDYGAYLDGKTLMQSVERAQRQRGANIMGGGVLV